MQVVKNQESEQRINNLLQGAKEYNRIKKQLADVENKYLTPKITQCPDSGIKRIWMLVNMICFNNPDINTITYSPKHYFLCVVAMIYSPRILAGSFLERGQRNIIAHTLKLSPSHISNSITKVCNWLEYYRDFRDGVDYLYTEIINRIDTYGLR